ncbi:MAG: hypothetical protein WD063_08485 [Pirellulales bacterium]
MNRTLSETSIDELIERHRYGARMIVAQFSDFEKHEGEIDPGEIGPLAWRQSVIVRKGNLVLCPPSQPVGEPPRLFNLDFDGFIGWDWNPNIDCEYRCPRRAIAAVYEERWDSSLAGYVVVLYDWALAERRCLANR